MAGAEGFPDRAVRLVEPFGRGGGPDLLARALAEPLSEVWGQPVAVENHAGGGSTAAPALVATSEPDGHTLLVNTSAHAYSAAVAGGLPYDPLRSFVPVAALTSQPYVLVAGGWTGVTTVPGLVAAATESEGLRFASTGVGTGSHVALERFNREVGISAVHVPAGPTEAIGDVVAGCVAGRTAYAMAPISAAMPYLGSGELAALGVSTARPSSQLPDVPPLAAAGVPGFDFPFWYGLWAPAGTPEQLVETIAYDVAATLATPELAEWLERHDAVRMEMSLPDFAAFVVEESAVAARMVVG